MSNGDNFPTCPAYCGRAAKKLRCSNRCSTFGSPPPSVSRGSPVVVVVVVDDDGDDDFDDHHHCKIHCRTLGSHH